MVGKPTEDLINAVDLAIVVDESEQLETVFADFLLSVDADTSMTPDRLTATVDRYGTDFAEVVLMFLADRGYVSEVDHGVWHVGTAYESCIALFVETWHALNVMDAASSELTDGSFELVCTLPEHDVAFDGKEPVDFGMRQITSALLSLCREARESITVVSPYLESTGVDWLLPGLGGALDRGVSVTLLSRELSRGEPNLNALEELCARASPGDGELRVYDYYEPRPNSDRPLYTLHSKIILSDERAAYVGSANFTKYGFSENLEIGTILRGGDVSQLSRLLDRIVAGSATEVFST